MSDGKKSRKHGRNRAFCKMYRDQWRREKNKEAKIKRHLYNTNSGRPGHPNDEQAKRALKHVYDRRAGSA